MLIPDKLIIDEIRDTHAYRDYVEEYGGVEVPMIKPKLVKSTRGMHRTPRATRTPNPADVQKPISTLIPPPSDDRERDEIHKATLLSLALHKTAKIVENHVNLVAVKEKILEEDVDKIIEGKDEESFAREFFDFVFLDEDSDTSIELESHKKNPKEVVDDVQEKKDDKKEEDDDDLTVSRKSENPQNHVVPTLFLQEFVAHALKIIKEIFKIHIQNMVVNVHSTTSASTATILFDLKYLLYLKMKMDLQAQVADLELWDVLRAKFEKSSAATGVCKTNTFRKQEDLKRPKPNALVFYGSQRNPYEPPRYLYNKDLFFLKYGNTEEKRSCVIWERVHDFQLGIESYQIKINLTEPTLIFPGIESFEGSQVKDLETRFLKKAPLLGDLDLKIMKTYGREIMKRLRHREQIRRWDCQLGPYGDSGRVGMGLLQEEVWGKKVGKSVV
uniref:Uncharacterized protein n=1 Tax=Tanacetum cinerariifolium TaxID=118510 RepID=A0A6L2M219_TANCI|nr:hypothetical protein [Tanacetum cinerariifolium]